MSRLFMIIGLLCLCIGLLLHFFPSAFSWFGRLPGDIRVESGNTRVYFPIVSMIIISVVLSILINLIRRF